MMQQVSVVDIAGRFERIRQWRSGDHRAPHKPLLLLFALARLTRGTESEPRLMAFSEVEAPLAELLAQFGRPAIQQRPQFPFWRLQADGLWEVTDRDSLRITSSGDPFLTDLRLVKGGLSADVYAALSTNLPAVHSLAGALLEAHFPPSLHDEILDAMGFHWQVVGRRPKRDPHFRKTILRIYERRCAVCGYQGMLGDTGWGLEAAHIRAHCERGPDCESNGLALCVFHHRALDRGVLGVDDSLRVLISQDANGSEHLEDWLFRYAGRPLRAPVPGGSGPDIAHVRWHYREVFRGPARAV